MPRRLPTGLALLLLLALAACGSSGGGGSGSYVGGSVALDCAPFARALSGVQLYGAAADWWPAAAGRYERGERPAQGAVLVLTRSGRLPYGHVAVVTKVVSSRQVLVTQANWVHHRVSEDQPVVDVSPDNDWSEVRVWWPPVGQMGTHEYPAYGFIYSPRQKSHDELIAATPHAVRIALAR